MTTAAEAILFAAQGVTVVDLDGVVESQTPYRVRCAGDDPDGTAAECVPLVAKPANAATVLVLQIGRHRYSFPKA